MKAWSTILGAALAVALTKLAPMVEAVDVATCSELAAVDRKTETEVTITTADFKCDEYTRLSIRSDMTLKSSVGALTISNLGLKIYGSLIVEPDVIFTGIVLEDVSGGAFKVQKDASLVFKGTADFIDISVEPRKDDDSLIVRKGGAINNTGSIVFEKDASFSGCYNGSSGPLILEVFETGGYSSTGSVSGGGGAVYQFPKGSMHFMGNLDVTDNSNFTDQLEAGRGEGGGFYNEGDVIVDGTATFSDNEGMDGGAIMQERWAKFVFNGPAVFENNLAVQNRGGAIANYGGVVDFKAGATFEGNVATSNGESGNGGAIWNYDGGDITLTSPTSFIDNSAYFAGAILSLVRSGFIEESFESENGRPYKVPTITIPDDTVFEGNSAGGTFCDDIAYEFDDDTCGL